MRENYGMREELLLCSLELGLDVVNLELLDILEARGVHNLNFL